MPGISWNLPTSIISPLGELALEDGASANGYVHDAPNCDVGLAVRSTSDNIPQGDGTIVHSRYLGGYVLRLSLQLYDGGTVADGETRREMYEELVLHLSAIFNADGRYKWTPEGADDRILDKVRLLEWPDPSSVQRALKAVTFTLDSPFPYAIDLAEVDVDVTGSTTVTNPGNVPYWPVIKVNRAFSAFTLTNHSVLDEDGNPLQIVYDDSLPGASAVASGHYAEITTFGGGKVYLDGDSSNLKAGIDVLASDFFPLAPGDNAIELSGADSATFLVNGAWGL